MSQKIILNPVTRISGFMAIEAIIENHAVVEAKTEGLLFRGFEKMLVGRNPFDAVYFTQRICGICSTAHAMASALALEVAIGVVPPEQGRYARDILHGCEFLQNHIRHFYQYTVPDFVRLPEGYALYETNHRDFRLPREKNDVIAAHCFESLAISRMAHEMLAVLGGKAPHNHGVFIGGITTSATTDKIIKVKSILSTIRTFIQEKMIPDACLIADYYREYFQIGGGYGNLLTFGCFNGYKDLGTLYVDPLVFSGNAIAPFHEAGITEEFAYAWYSDPDQSVKSLENNPEDNMDKPGAYSWIKAPRYEHKPFETGPLARQWLSDAYRNGISVMDRTIARVLEADKICEIMGQLIEQLIPNLSFQESYPLPENAAGSGLMDTTRGALGHWLKIDKQVLSLYQIITPSAWNLSSRSSDALKGTAEQALIGTVIQDMDHPMELGRIIRSFDPCVSCATHVWANGNDQGAVIVMP